MIKFRRFLVESVRMGLPHITTMAHDQFGNLIKHGSFQISNVTEKTDGMPHEFGYDEGGFYTRTKPTGETKVRSRAHYEQLLQAKASERFPYKPEKANTYSHIHEILHNNPELQSHLSRQFTKTGTDVRVKGEILYKPLSQESEYSGERRFVATSYRTDHMGKYGKFVVHTSLPENAGHSIQALKAASSSLLNFDDDKIEHQHSVVPISKDIADRFATVDKDLIASRTTKTNKESKLAEIAKFDGIKKDLSDAVDQHFRQTKPKWGSETEGYVVHPTHDGMPRFKVTSDTFRQRRLEGPVTWAKDEGTND